VTVPTTMRCSSAYNGALAVSCVLIVAGACGPTAETRLVDLRQKSLTIARMDDDSSAAANGGSERVASDLKNLRQDYVSLAKDFPGHAGEVNRTVDIIDKRLALLDDEQQYSSRITMSNLRRQTGTVGGLDLPADGVFGEVRNHGQRIVGLLTLRLDLLDNAGRPVGDVTATIASPGKSEPIPPGSVRQFGVAVGHPHAAWTAVRGAVKSLRLSRQGLRFPGEPDTH
jgi:hypothetical protein